MAGCLLAGAILCGMARFFAAAYWQYLLRPDYMIQAYMIHFAFLARICKIRAEVVLVIQ